MSIALGTFDNLHFILLKKIVSKNQGKNVYNC